MFLSPNGDTWVSERRTKVTKTCYEWILY